MKTLSGVFVNLEAAERACRQLEAHGVERNQLSLTFDEHCPACAYERDFLARNTTENLPLGQGIGAILGIALGVTAVFWPFAAFPGVEGVPPESTTLSLFDWMLRLFIIASWTLSGGILGGMVAAMASDAWHVLRRRDGEKAPHSHYILSFDSTLAEDAVVRSIIQRRGGRLIETSATLRIP